MIFFPVAGRRMMCRVVACFLIAAAGTAVAGHPARAGSCPQLDLSRIWIPADIEDARDAVLAKARQLNDSGNCVTDGWYAREARRYRFNVVPLGSRDSIGRITSFSIKELHRDLAGGEAAR